MLRIFETSGKPFHERAHAAPQPRRQTHPTTYRFKTKKRKAKRMYLGLSRNARALYELKEGESSWFRNTFNMSILRVSAYQGDF